MEGPLYRDPSLNPAGWTHLRSSSRSMQENPAFGWFLSLGRPTNSAASKLLFRLAILRCVHRVGGGEGALATSLGRRISPSLTLPRKRERDEHVLRPTLRGAGVG